MKDMMLMLSNYFRMCRKDEKGQGMVEYALILVLVSIAAIATLTPLGGEVAGVFTDITASFTGGTAPAP